LGLACGDRQDRLRLDPAESLPTQSVTIDGLASDTGEPAAVFTTVGDQWADWSLEIPTRKDSAGRLVVQVPVHPAGLDVGGEVELTVVGVSHSPVPLKVKPAPADPGATQDFVKNSALIGRRLIESLGWDMGDVLRTLDDEPGALPPQIFFPALAVHLLDDPAHENSLARIVDGTAPVLSGRQLDVDALDRLISIHGLAAAMRELASAADQLAIPPPATRTSRAEPSRHVYFASLVPVRPQDTGLSVVPVPRDGRVEINTPGALDFWMRRRAEVEETWGGLKRDARNDIADLLGWVPHGGAAILGTANIALEWAVRSNLELLPSVLDSLDVQVDVEEFWEDDERVGAWTASVIARSGSLKFSYADFVDAAATAWEAGKFVKGAGGALRQSMKGAAPKAEATIARLVDEALVEAEDAAKEIAEYAGQRVADRSKNWSDARADVLGPYEWGPIDVSSTDWTLANISSHLGEPDCARVTNLQRNYVAIAAGECLLVVETRREGDRFGGVSAWGNRRLFVRAIDVEVIPNGITVAPGDERTFSTIVRNAFLTTVDWRSDGGQGRLVENTLYRWTAPKLQRGRCRTLATVEAESTTRTGPRESGDPPRIGRATVTVRDPNALEIIPGGALGSVILAPGEEIEFGVRGDVTNVVWTADGGTIDSSGRYMAPSDEGEYEVFAQADGADRDCGDQVTVLVRGCSWTFNVDGRLLHSGPGDRASFMVMPGGLQIALERAGASAVTLMAEGATGETSGTIPGGAMGSLGVSEGEMYGSFNETGEPTLSILIERSTDRVVTGRASGSINVFEMQNPMQSRAAAISATFVIAGDEAAAGPAGIPSGFSGITGEPQLRQLQEMAAGQMQGAGFRMLQCEVGS
jgi:hypothetical protein